MIIFSWNPRHAVQYSPWSNHKIDVAGRVTAPPPPPPLALAATGAAAPPAAATSGGGGGGGGGGGWGYWEDRRGKPGWIFNGSFPLARSSGGRGGNVGVGEGSAAAGADAADVEAEAAVARAASPVLSFPVPTYATIHRVPRLTLGCVAVAQGCLRTHSYCAQLFCFFFH